jgi:group I intron endonuclease
MGIYKITNVETGQVYVGSSKNIYQRLGEHLAMLNKGTHHSSKLQESYDTATDKSIFKPDIIELIDNQDQLIIREQYYIELYHALDKGYNCSTPFDISRHNQEIIKKYKLTYLSERARKAYLDFYSLYNPDHVFIDPKFYKSIQKRNCGSPVINQLNLAMRWFYANFDKSIHKIYLYATIHSASKYYFNISDKNDHPFCAYFHNRKNVYFFPQHTHTYQTILRNEGQYKPEVHDWIVKTPIIRSMAKELELFNQFYQFHNK